MLFLITDVPRGFCNSSVLWESSPPVLQVHCRISYNPTFISASWSLESAGKRYNGYASNDTRVTTIHQVPVNHPQLRTSYLSHTGYMSTSSNHELGLSVCQHSTSRIHLSIAYNHTCTYHPPAISHQVPVNHQQPHNGYLSTTSNLTTCQPPKTHTR